jgi:hypothetical protein
LEPLRATIEDGDKSIAGGDMTINRTLAVSILMSAVVAAGSGPAMAQACTREGANVSCDDGRRGILRSSGPTERDRA